MTVLDNPPRSGSSRQARRDVERAAQSLQNLVGRFVRAAVERRALGIAPLPQTLDQLWRSVAERPAKAARDMDGRLDAMPQRA